MPQLSLEDDLGSDEAQSWRRPSPTQDPSDLLVSGGDGRIALDPATRENRYGCAGVPITGVAAFGSSTASVISPRAFAAVEGLAARLGTYPSASQAYGAEAQRIRLELAALCGLPAAAADNIILGASGTDLHLIAAELVCGSNGRLLTSVMADAAETGRGVPAALASLHFGATAAHSPRTPEGERLAGSPGGQVIAVPLREMDGAARPACDVDHDFEAACGRAVRAGGKVLLTLVDVSKTGLVAPSAACAVQLKARFGDAVEVLVDACQFRLTPESLQAYLSHGFLVAITGSKFVTGPAFSGALLMSAATAQALRDHPLLPALGDYSGRHDWPQGWAAHHLLPDSPNLGLVLRWEAALQELRAFRQLRPTQIAWFLSAFAAAVDDRLEADPRLEPVRAPVASRLGAGGWDRIPTIFPFLLRGPEGALGGDRTDAAYRALRGGVAGRPIHLGQPVTIGVRDGRPISTLRLCASARLAVEACTGPEGPQAVIQRALDALEAAASQAPV